MTKKSDAIRKTFISERSNYLHVLSGASIVLAILIIYWQDLSILANEALQSEAVSHIILIPFLIAYLVYRKKELVKASSALEKLRRRTTLVSFTDILGVAVCLSAFLLYWYGSYTFYALEYHIVSLPIFVAGVTLILFNVETLKALIFPILFLLFLIPPPSTITYTAGAITANFHTQASYTLLRACGLDIQLETAYGPPTIILNAASESSISFAVDLPCSGIYSLIAFIMFAAFLSYITHGSIIKKITLFLTGFLILQVLNIIRISSIVLVGNWLGEEIAMNIFHVVSGWIFIFLGILALLLMAERIWKMQIFTGPKRIPPCPKCKKSLEKNEAFCNRCGKFLKGSSIVKISKRFWIKIAALLLGCYLVTLSLQAPVFALAQAPEALSIESPSTQETSTEIFPNMTDYQPPQFMYRDTQYEKIAHQDASLLYAYSSINASDPVVWVDVGVADSISNLHSWEVCFVTYQMAQGRQPLVTVLNSRDVQLLENPPITARFFTFQQEANYIQVTLYWYERAAFKTGLTVEQKYVRISLLTFTSGDYTGSEEKLLTLGKSIAAYWEPKKSSALISLGIAFQQGLLVIAVGFVAVARTAQYARKLREKRNALRIFERFASPKEKLVVDTLKELSEKTETTTTDAITSALEEAAGNAMKEHKLYSILNRLEESKIIQRDIENVNDEPIMVWKP